VRELLERASTVAVVGASTDPERQSYAACLFLIGRGFEVIPIHPTAGHIHGRRAYPSLDQLPHHVDIVVVFEGASEAPEIAARAVAAGAGALWLEAGLTSTEARRIAEEAGMGYLENRSIVATTRLLAISRRPRETEPPSAYS
jgi:predicted CoA-binding protein